MGQAAQIFFPHTRQRSLVPLPGRRMGKPKGLSCFLLRGARLDDPVQEVPISRTDNIKTGHCNVSPVRTRIGLIALETRCPQCIVIDLDLAPRSVAVLRQVLHEIAPDIANQRRRNLFDPGQIDGQDAGADAGDQFAGQISAVVRKSPPEPTVDRIQRRPDGKDCQRGCQGPDGEVALRRQDERADHVISKVVVSADVVLVQKEFSGSAEHRQHRCRRAQFLELGFGRSTVQAPNEGSMQHRPSGTHDVQPFGRASGASRGLVMEFRELESSTGALRTPAVVSGLVEGVAVAADRLDRQAHLVVMAVHADMQIAAVADAEQLAAFEAAPLGARGTRMAPGGHEGWQDGEVRTGHRRLL